MALVGRRLVAGSGNTLSVYDIERRGLHALGGVPIPDSPAETRSHGLVSRRGGVFYVNSLAAAFSPRVDPASSTVAAFRLRRDGRLQLLKTKTNRAVPNPTPFLDATGRFLYVASEAGNAVDTYRIGPDGRLSPAVSRLKIDRPTGMVFFGGAGRQGRPRIGRSKARLPRPPAG